MIAYCVVTIDLILQSLTFKLLPHHAYNFWTFAFLKACTLLSPLGIKSCACLRAPRLTQRTLTYPQLGTVGHPYLPIVGSFHRQAHWALKQSIFFHTHRDKYTHKHTQGIWTQSTNPKREMNINSQTTSSLTRNFKNKAFTFISHCRQKPVLKPISWPPR